MQAPEQRALRGRGDQATRGERLSMRATDTREARCGGRGTEEPRGALGACLPTHVAACLVSARRPSSDPTGPELRGSAPPFPPPSGRRPGGAAGPGARVRPLERGVSTFHARTCPPAPAHHGCNRSPTSRSRQDGSSRPESFTEAKKQVQPLPDVGETSRSRK